MEYIHETIQVHAWHWADVSWTRKTTLAFFYAPAYSTARTSHFRVRAITPKPYGIYSWNFTCAYITIRRCPAYSKNSGRALSVTPVRPVRLSFRPSVCPSVCLSIRTSHFCVQAITSKPYGIYAWNFTGAYITIRRCVMNKEDNSCVFGFWIISPWLNSI